MPVRTPLRCLILSAFLGLVACGSTRQEADGLYPPDANSSLDFRVDLADDLRPDSTLVDLFTPDLAPLDLKQDNGPIDQSTPDVTWDQRSDATVDLFGPDKDATPADLQEVGPADTAGDTVTDAAQDAAVDLLTDTTGDMATDSTPGTEPWVVGPLVELPSKYDLWELPGEGAGPPVVTSNNPESFESEGFLYQTARVDPVRGGAIYPMSGTFGLYLHHLNKSGKTMYVHILLTNPNQDSVTVSGHGSGYNQTETGGLGFGYGPDVQVAEDWLSGDYNHTLAAGPIGSFKARQAWVKQVANGAEVDGRFEFTASEGVYVYVIAAESSDVNDAVGLTQVAATGDIKPPGNPPPPFGREAGVYAHGRWAGQWELSLPPAGQPHYVGYIVNTATGIGLEQIQAFPALTHFSDSSAESVGMYGNTYALDVAFQNPGDSDRTVEVHFAALGQGSPSFFFNGPIKVDGTQVMTILKPTERKKKIGQVLVPAGGSASTSLEIFIQGLSSIPQALFFVVQ